MASSACADVSVRVEGVPAIQQPDSLACWITVATMMKSWRDETEYTIEDVLAELGEPWQTFYEDNRGLAADMQDRFASEFGLKSKPPANYMLEAYVDLLKEFGPLWITTGNGFSAHARLLISIHGDGSYENTEFRFIDPATGTHVTQSALDFVMEFEREATVAVANDWESLRIQIYHY